MTAHLSSRHLRSPRTIIGLAVLSAGSVALLGTADPAAAAQPVGLGTATSFAVLAASTVTSTGATSISGDVGVSPKTAVTGLTPAMVSNGSIHSADATAASAQAALTTAYNAAAGQRPDVQVTADLGGQTLTAGVYSGTTLGLTGPLTLDAKGKPDAVFVFQAAKTLTVASASSVVLTNGASACNVFWQVGSSASLDTYVTFVGSVLAQASISVATASTVQGRLLARTGAVTLQGNHIARPTCATPPRDRRPVRRPRAVRPRPRRPAAARPAPVRPHRRPPHRWVARARRPPGRPWAWCRRPAAPSSAARS